MIKTNGRASNLIHEAVTLNFNFKSDARNISFYGFKSCLRNKSFALCSSTDRPKWSSSSHIPNENLSKHRTHQKNDKLEKEEKEERKAHCEVEVISWRERRIKAEIVVYADVESVWDALTDYERLADFIPNLVSR